MESIWKVYLGSVVLAAAGSTMVRPIPNATQSETIGFVLIMVSLIGCGYFLKMSEKKENK